MAEKTTEVGPSHVLLASAISWGSVHRDTPPPQQECQNWSWKENAVNCINSTSQILDNIRTMKCSFSSFIIFFQGPHWLRFSEIWSVKINEVWAEEALLVLINLPFRRQQHSEGCSQILGNTFTVRIICLKYVHSLPAVQECPSKLLDARDEGVSRRCSQGPLFCSSGHSQVPAEAAHAPDLACHHRVCHGCGPQ